MAAGRLTVEVTASTFKLNKALEKVEHKIKDTGKTLDDQMSTPLGKATLMAGKLFAAMGAIEGATKLASTAVSGIQGLFAGLSGDAEGAQRAFDAMAETAKSLPFGIGPVVAAFEQILFTVSGINERMHQQEKMLERQADLDRRIAEARARADTLRSLQDEIRLLNQKDELNRADLQYLIDFQRAQREHDARMRASLEKSMSEQAAIFRDSDKQLRLERELARLRMEAAIEAEQERREAERLLKIKEQERIAEREAAIAKREELLAARELERLEAKRLREMEKAAKEIARIQEQQRKQEQDAATAVTTAQTAFGQFTFGQVRSGGGQEKANNHLQNLEEGVKALLQVVQVGMRGMGFR